MNRIKRKENKEEKIKQRQSSAYTRDQLVDFLLDFLDSYDDFDKAEPCSQMIDIDFAVFLNSFLDRVETNNENERESNKHIAYQIIKLVSKADGFTYIYHSCDKLNDGYSFLFYCNCKVERKPKNVLVDDPTKRRNTESRLPRYTCEGSVLITIKRSHELAYIRLHHLPHPQPRSIAVSSEIKEYIQQNKLLTIPQIYHNIKALGLNGYIYVTQQQIYYWCKRLGINEYKMAEDQIESTIQYLSQQTIFKLIIQQPTIIAFTTPLFDIFPKEQITVIAVDATYNTNRLKYELYVILGIIDGAGFPLTYLLLKPDQEEKRSKILLNWFYLIKEQGIHHVQTFLTDKDFAQITSAQIVWPHVRVQLCYWHVLRAIKRKLSSSGITYSPYNAREAHTICSEIDPTWQPASKNQNIFNELSLNNELTKNMDKYQVFCQKDHRENIIQLVRVHFFVHPLIPTENRPKLYNLQEIWSNCVKEQHNYSHINILRSSMTVESHWKVIKHEYLSEYNRARLDLLVYLIVTRVVPGLVDRLQQLRDGRIVTRWRSDCKTEWYQLKKKNQLSQILKELLMRTNGFAHVLVSCLADFLS
ncbi:34846_t:CDS:2, partial [Gigaspora margarita]